VALLAAEGKVYEVAHEEEKQRRLPRDNIPLRTGSKDANTWLETPRSDEISSGICQPYGAPPNREILPERKYQQSESHYNKQQTTTQLTGFLCIFSG
jgi:hypothetical protein